MTNRPWWSFGPAERNGVPPVEVAPTRPEPQAPAWPGPGELCGLVLPPFVGLQLEALAAALAAAAEQALEHVPEQTPEATIEDGAPEGSADASPADDLGDGPGAKP